MIEGWRERSWADPLLVAVLALAVYAVHGFNGPLDHDLGVFVYGGTQFAHGVPPYVGIFNSVGPLADAVPGLAIWLGGHLGVDPVLSARVLFLLLAATCCALVLVLAREVLGSRAAAWMSAGVFLTFEEFLTLAGSGPREKTTMVLFLLGALILLVRRRWFGAGVCTSLATLTWQPVLAPAVVVAAILIGAGPRRLRSATSFIGGGAIPLALTMAYFAAYGRLDRAVDGFVVVNLDTTQPSLLGDFAYIRRVMWHGYHLSIFLVIAGLVALVVVAAARRTLPLLALAGGGLTATAWTLYAVNGPPDLFVVLPFAALGMGAALAALAARLSPTSGLVLAVVVTVACVNLAVVEAAQRRNDDLAVERANVEDVLRAAPAGAGVWSIDAPQVLALAQRRNPTSYQLFNHNMVTYLDRELPGGLSAYLAGLVAARPTLLVTPRLGMPDWAREELLPDYRRVGRGPDWTWWITRTASPAQVADVVEANERRPYDPIGP